jgi:hypothetical protein
LIDKPYKYNSHLFRTEHKTFEDEIVKFSKIARVIRNEIFILKEDIIDKDEFDDRIISK